MNIYNMTPQEAIAFLNTDDQTGLSLEQVNHRRAVYGLNQLAQVKPPSIAQLFIKQFKDPLIYFLLIAAGIIIAMGNFSDALVTLVVVLFNACIGTYHERNAQRTLEQLKSLITVSALAIRGRKRIIVDSSELVPGDIIVLQEGDQVPADARIIKAQDLRVNESVLTGETSSVEKSQEKLSGDKSLFEQTNVLFKGTTITSGFAQVVVVSTGSSTEIGKIQKAAQESETETPLQKELGRLSHSIVFLAIGLCAVLLIVGIMTGRPAQELFSLLVALFIGIVPEGLPVVFALTLIAGARRLARRHVLVKRLDAAEALGRVDVIVIDKTGTLTRNEMVVRSVYVDGESYNVSGEGYLPEGEIKKTDGTLVFLDQYPWLKTLADAALLLDTSEKKYSEVTKSYQIKGEPTEAALGVFAQKLNAQAEGYSKVHEIPFNFALRVHIGFFEREGRLVVLISGAPEAVFETCNQVQPEAQEALNNFLKRGLRTVAFAVYTPQYQPEGIDWLDYYKLCRGRFQLLGLVGIEDTIRPEVRDAIFKTRAAGVDVIMATGDHASTATHIAEQTGILLPGDLSMQGHEIEGRSPEQLSLLDLTRVKVFSRVTPHDKLVIVNLLRKQGKIVAMTGDGINDVPSLVAADVGIAMGLIGTDVAKEAADMVLLDDSFSSIVRGLQEGRHIFATLRRVIWYFFSTNLSEIAVVIYAFITNLPVPLGAAQILWLNVVTDGFLDVALAQEPHEEGLLSRSRRHTANRLFDGRLLSKIFLDAVVMTSGSLFIFRVWYPVNLAVARTMVLVTLAMFQWFNAWNCRSERESILQRGIFTNPWLIVATFVVLVLQVAVVYVPFLQRLFKTVPLTAQQWLSVILLTSSIIIVEECRKWCARLLKLRATQQL